MTPPGEGDGVVLHAEVHLCRIRFEIGRDKPVCRALHFCAAASNPELDADEAYGGQAEEKEEKDRQMIADHGEVGPEARWIHATLSLSEPAKPRVTSGAIQPDLVLVFSNSMLFIGTAQHGFSAKKQRLGAWSLRRR